MSESPEVKTIRIAYMFTGQGFQKEGMWQELEGFPAAGKIFQVAEEITGDSLYTGALDETSRAQPAVVAHSLAALAVAKELYPQIFATCPDFCIGHSVGEYSALIAVGAIDLETGISLVGQRGRLMEEAGKINPGRMAALLGFKDKEEVVAICQETGAEIANYNCPGQIVISGPVQNIEDAVRLAKERRMKAAELGVSVAAHSSLMEPVKKKFAEVLETVNFKMPEIPVISNVTAEPYESVDRMRELLAKQLTLPVRWEESVLFALEKGVTTFIEFGPKPVLTGLLRQISREAKGIFVVDKI